MFLACDTCVGKVLGKPIDPKKSVACRFGDDVESGGVVCSSVYLLIC